AGVSGSGSGPGCSWPASGSPFGESCSLAASACSEATVASSVTVDAAPSGSHDGGSTGCSTSSLLRGFPHQINGNRYTPAALGWFVTIWAAHGMLLIRRARHSLRCLWPFAARAAGIVGRVLGGLIACLIACLILDHGTRGHGSVRRFRVAGY